MPAPYQVRGKLQQASRIKFPKCLFFMDSSRQGGTGMTIFILCRQKLSNINHSATPSQIVMGQRW
jgi:hypothetical protein